MPSFILFLKIAEPSSARVLAQAALHEKQRKGALKLRSSTQLDATGLLLPDKVLQSIRSKRRSQRQ